VVVFACTGDYGFSPSLTSDSHTNFNNYFAMNDIFVFILAQRNFSSKKDQCCVVDDANAKVMEAFVAQAAKLD